MARRQVPTPWDLRGRVMRHVASQEVPGRLVLLDGVKVIQEEGWALVIPAPDEPASRVWAEGSDRAAADRLADHYAALVEEAVRMGAESTDQQVDK